MKKLDENRLREFARKRVEFRTHLIVYIITIGSMWLIWFFTSQGYLWPIWPTAIWGIGLVFHYVFDYRSSKLFSEEEEYQKLKRKIERDMAH